MDSGNPNEVGASSFLPPFANAENKALDSEVRDLERQLEATDVGLEENSDRVGIMEEHLKNVQQELKYTQNRVESKNKEIETENHLQSLADREAGRIQKDLAKLEKERSDLLERIAALQAQIFKGNEKMDQFKLLMNWNQEELEQWAFAERQKQEDNAALDRYKHADSARVKQMRIEIEKVNRDVLTRKEEMENEVAETQAAQIQLDKAAEDFRRLHQERQNLVRQWDEALEAMHHRDEAIAAASESFAAERTILRSKQQELDEQSRSLDGEVANNREVDARIALCDRDLAKARETLGKDQARLKETDNQLDLIKGTLSKTAGELSNRETANVEMRETLDAKRRKLDASRKRHALLKRRLDTEFGNLDSLESKATELEALRKQEEQRLTAVTKEHMALKKEQYVRSQHLFDLRQKERGLISEISGGQGQDRNLSSRIRSLDEQVIRQQELLYNVEFQVQQMERKVSRAKGVRSEEETRALNARIEKLTAILEGVNAEHGTLLQQVKHAEDDLLNARRRSTALRTDRGRIDESLATLKLENEMVSRQVKGQIEAKEKNLVEHDVLALEVKRLRDILAAHADEVFSLENRKFQLKMSMEERRQEIEIHRDGLRAELRLLRDDVHRVTLELNERLARVEKLQSKCETISSKHRGAGDAEDAEEKSQAYYVIKAAQEREELQREGDALDSKIQKAEKEVAALEQTLVQLVSANNGLGGSYKRVEGPAASGEKLVLRQRLDRVYDKLKSRRAEEAALAEDLKLSAARLLDMQRRQREMESTIQELTGQRTEAVRMLDDQKERLSRATRQTDRLRGKLGFGNGSEAPLAKEIELAEVRDVSRTMLGELRALAMANPLARVVEFCEGMGVRLPPTAGSALGGAGTSSGSVGGGRINSRGNSRGNSRPTSGSSQQ
mmetsp:Transcript_9124/g.17160  ORF Transcript_9124/g.17160 Transcript_9124/m.17160 type:complete len:907 (-) Transcript_9124:51-2771(-)|eukprot:CAMPEP_0175039758 /NCGR_PEP_ID=MMETSP0052_2-20121109/813_1 /TAXON_ID=51329 ORGANISM="Polytomella parva, Strain SAG 63-3" /NCGR_SAMPLE_ID=MMETSP0052_2 /ASSEMBLY_ACC=CAM_ASM_000194 /LENGTH=906 /DNA_ID=CAMNT_0016301749 /DNA_START=26 /DNA_END=2746 /DNA_ORIENTATION=+